MLETQRWPDVLTSAGCRGGPGVLLAPSGTRWTPAVYLLRGMLWVIGGETQSTT
jgi:hypothetical protein